MIIGRDLCNWVTGGRDHSHTYLTHVETRSMMLCAVRNDSHQMAAPPAPHGQDWPPPSEAAMAPALAMKASTTLPPSPRTDGGENDSERLRKVTGTEDHLRRRMTPPRAPGPAGSPRVNVGS